MHSVPLSLIILIFLVGLVTYLAYWHLLHPFLVLKLRYRLFALRDRLRLALITGEIGLHQPAYKILEERCNLFLRGMSFVGLSLVFFGPVERSLMLRLKRDADTVQEASSILREMYAELSNLALGICVANSPIYFPFIVIWLATSEFSNSAKKRLDNLKQRTPCRKLCHGLSGACALIRTAFKPVAEPLQWLNKSPESAAVSEFSKDMQSPCTAFAEAIPDWPSETAWAYGLQLDSVIEELHTTGSP